jgi:hypothetical protein
MPAEEAHRDATWVLTVVGGMSITKALESLSGVAPQASSSNTVLLMRLLIFGFTAIRFFIGASVFFQQVHVSKEHATTYPDRNYVVDFSFAIIHFCLLYLLATCIPYVTRETYFSRQHFFMALLAVLLYDWLWWLGSFHYSTARSIQKWAIANSVTAVFCSLVFLLFRFEYIDRSGFEVLLLICVVLFSFPDMMRMARGDIPKA